ncbi:hypothetical protein DFO45_2671 [Azorhizobium sp. AG788]|uniref:HK97 family phage prohead protease n=1 Tax=Azorhizobium sp. AG788 TaxID=2183897 RepID=UPI00105D44D2|nr:HK97 family phage prohead protease [Azorhizobium sp. AG788]TDT94913.1 hypothetical protein DFO45_2671 [Azorhizobium sp. AG788]
MSLEKRTLSRPMEVRAASTGRTAVGYAAVFNSPTQIGDWFIEEVAPGAFDDAVAGGDVRALFDHNSARLLGRTTSGTLRLGQDAIGLAVEIDLPDTGDGRDVATLLERGDITGMSFGFMVTKETWDETGNIPKRTIQKVDLLEVSIVSFPAYADTSVALRSLEGRRKEQRRQNFSAAARRLRMKAHLDLAVRSKA